MTTSFDGSKRMTSPYRSTPPPPPSSASFSRRPEFDSSQPQPQPQPQHITTPSLSSSSPFYPGFLGSKYHNDDEFRYPSGSASPGASSSSSTSPPSRSRRSSPSASPSSPGLPYLVDSPQPESWASTKYPSPTKHLQQQQQMNRRAVPTFPSRSRSIPLGLEVGREPKSKSPGPKKRPVPLNLGKAAQAFGVDEEMVVQREDERQRPLTASSVVSDSASSLSNELQDLSLLRKTVRQNLKARPLDSPLPASDSERESTGFPTPELGYSQQQALSALDGDTINMDDTLKLLQSSPQLLIIDTRPLGSFLDSHLPRSANISIPSLIFKRLRKSPNGQNTSWHALGGFVSTQAGRSIWESLEPHKHMDVIIVGSTATDELAKVLFGIMKNLVIDGSVQVLKGGWGSVMSSADAQEMLVSGEDSTALRPSLATSLPPPKSAPAYDVSPVPPPIPPSSPPNGLNHRPSMPTLRALPGKIDSRRNLPSLSINGGSGGHLNGPSTSRRTPKLSLNLDKPLKSATTGSFNLDQPPPTPGAGLAPSKSGLLSVDPSKTGQSIRSTRSPGFTLNIPKTPGHTGGSFHTLCHAQSKLPPSPSSFGDVKRIGNDEDLTSLPRTPLPGASFGCSAANEPNGNGPTEDDDSEDSIALSTAKNGIAPFLVSTILPSFLYLGPEISSKEDVNRLKKLGVKRILNVALECNDDAGLGLKEDFKYHRIPMRDIVEESGVARGMREACGFLDDARLHSAPTYVHCKAGKSRSVTVVLAYLIHANAWTLKTSYAYVAERRKGISPNIGFVAELMQFEEIELGLKQSGGVHGDSSSGGSSNVHRPHYPPGTRRSNGDHSDSDNDVENNDKGEKERRNKNNRTRESLPPTWSHSLNVTSTTSGRGSSPLANGYIGDLTDDSKKKEDERQREEEEERKRRQVGDEREVRKNGQWVHHRRAPVDRTTLQPGRRVSKAGLESLRPLNTTSITPTSSSGSHTAARPSPSLGPGGGGESKDKQHKHSVTPAGDGPLKWV
ncbi:uncharacterized protein I303_103599 [Kwoniella dejecticola CBS 10117]|uniref:protein-tyrosine-phosphatase n=1 Tax=Kwoniella dejecticola CBS 10117 TaxID=1296121 RepID=A0A1A6A772_9TREE|nr:uncharacterized protein I303_03621 [Kwoniella dejecticola CBS 10117]OBR85906.1 hypothetical protein I303_03621 [Kwoniella dejecticola CBS 10117]